jgi:RHS repeat-associated protein
VRTLQNNTDTLQWILSDHLGSASTTANADGSWNSTIQYTAYGEIRLTKGITPTKYRYTGQLAQAEVGLDYYVACWYDPLTGHFTSADTIVSEPGVASAFDRYGYVSNNPIRYNDPSGHRESGECERGEICKKEKKGPLQPPKPPEISKKICTMFDNCSETPPPGLFYKPAPSSTPTPKSFLNSGPISTPTQPFVYQPSSKKVIDINWERLVDKNKVDWIDFGIDVGGIVGQLAGYVGGVPGKGIFAISEIAETGGGIKSLVDLVSGDTTNMTLLVAKTISTGVDFGRVDPNSGITFNIISLAINVVPAIDLDAISQ